MVADAKEADVAVDERAPRWPYRIILVDDDPQVREIFGEALRDCGWPVTTAADADGGLDAMGDPPRPSMLITDIDLGPGPSGLLLADHTRIRFPFVPIILISGHWNPEVENHGVPDAVLLRKPFRASALIELVSRYLPVQAPLP